MVRRAVVRVGRSRWGRDGGRGIVARTGDREAEEAGEDEGEGRAELHGWSLGVERRERGWRILRGWWARKEEMKVREDARAGYIAIGDLMAGLECAPSSG